MFEKKIKAIVGDISRNAQTKFQCYISVETTVEDIGLIQAGTLVAAENIFHHTKNPRYCILQVISSFPEKQARRSVGKIQLTCQAAPLGIELRIEKPRAKTPVVEIGAADTVPLYEAEAFVLDSDMTRTVLHHLAPESRSKENGSRIDIGTCATNPDVNIGVEAMSLIRGNVAIVSAKPRARTSITNTLVHALLQGTGRHVHIVYCDVNYTGTLSLAHEFGENDHSMLLCLNDRFLPSSVFSALRNQSDRQMFKRAVFDYLDMMILPSIMENRRRDFTYPLANAMRKNRVSVYRPHEPTVNEFINEIRVDLIDGLDEDGITIVSELMNGIANHFQGERFNERNVADIIDMIDETSQDVKAQSVRRTLLDLRNEIQTQFESISKDIPASARVTVEDMVRRLNSEHHSSLTIAQGQRGTDILRFVSTILQRLTEERLQHLKTRTPVLFIFNNADEYLTRNGGAYRETGTERFVDILNTMLTAGRRHGIGFALTLENAASLDAYLARKIQAYFIGPIRFVDDLQQLEKLLNVSQDLIQDAVTFEDGFCFYTNSESPYQRRVPLPVTFPTNIQTLHDFLDAFLAKQEQLRQEREREERERRIREEQNRQQEKKVRRDSDSRRKREPESSAAAGPDSSSQHEEESQEATARSSSRASRSRRPTRSRSPEASSASSASGEETAEHDDAQQREERATRTGRSRGSRSGRRTRSRKPASSTGSSEQERQGTATEANTVPADEHESEPATAPDESGETESVRSSSTARRSSRSGRRPRSRKPDSSSDSPGEQQTAAAEEKSDRPSTSEPEPA